MADEEKVVPEATYLIFETTDEGRTLKKVGERVARSSDQALRKHHEENGTAEGVALAAVSENYFRLRRPTPKVITQTLWDDVEWAEQKGQVADDVVGGQREADKVVWGEKGEQESAVR